MPSIWSQTVKLPTFPTLDKDLNTDILIIGGGLAGVLCCYQLTRAGVDCALVEARTICSGVTKDTTAKITSQHGLIYQKLLREFGPDAARLYYEANEEALGEYRTLSKKLNFDFVEEDNFIYAREDITPLKKEMAALDALNIPSYFAHALPLPFPVAGAVAFPR
ncbi:MAG: FAD-binding oxidoreductase, partial [Oscillospiraceae bacterium]|nr:FAD-binding oxidoreductase [Oscillospiraceae bacterium]